ncbi:MAG: polysaccharide deacetylase family protein [Bacteroidota bacterium]|nr:polysaccharide deacetylase family protein [Bacteroidota bacterium]
MIINVGIFSRFQFGWQILLQQAGVPFTIANSELSVSQYSALVVGDSIDDDVVQQIKRYLADGGAVLCSGEIFSRLSKSQGTVTFIRYLFEEDNSDFTGIGLVDVFTKCNLPRNANALRTNDGKRGAFLSEYRGGIIIALPFDAGKLVLDNRTVAKSFYAKGQRLPFERVSLISKGNLLRLVVRSLEILHHQRGLPFVHKWYFPEDSSTVFCWRIDTDYALQSEIEKLASLLQAEGIPATWFVHAKAQEKFFKIFNEMNNHEIGIHCYEHQTYKDYHRNIQNIRKVIEVFNRNGLRAASYAAPFGKWNDGIARAINECGFDYSSEFSYDYDNVPSYPLIDGIFSATLHVPIHPICIGSLRRQGFDESAMVEYFENVLKRKLSLKEPILLYHHPRDGNENVLKSIFNFVRNNGIKVQKMIEYSQWWKRRIESGIQIMFDHQILTLASSDAPSDVWLHLTKPDGTESFMPVQPRIDLQKLIWKSQSQPLPLPNDIHRIRKFNPRIPLNLTEDYLLKIFRR